MINALKKMNVTDGSLCLIAFENLGKLFVFLFEIIFKRIMKRSMIPEIFRYYIRETPYSIFICWYSLLGLFIPIIYQKGFICKNSEKESFLQVRYQIVNNRQDHSGHSAGLGYRIENRENLSKSCLYLRIYRKTHKHKLVFRK